MDPQTHAHAVHIEITVNKEPFTWHEETITGNDVLNLAKETADKFDVYIKRKGHEDILVQPTQIVDLREEDNRHFRTVPKEITEG
jgi:hypothetical protein